MKDFTKQSLSVSLSVSVSLSLCLSLSVPLFVYLQSDRMEDQRCPLPDLNEVTGSVPEGQEDFFSLIQKVQSRRMDEQRASLLIPHTKAGDDTHSAGSSLHHHHHWWRYMCKRKRTGFYWVLFLSIRQSLDVVIMIFDKFLWISPTAGFSLKPESRLCWCGLFDDSSACWLQTDTLDYLEFKQRSGLIWDQQTVLLLHNGFLSSCWHMIWLWPQELKVSCWVHVFMC